MGDLGVGLIVLAMFLPVRREALEFVPGLVSSRLLCFAGAARHLWIIADPECRRDRSAAGNS
jgi:hypothetical protein